MSHNTHLFPWVYTSANHGLGTSFVFTTTLCPPIYVTGKKMVHRGKVTRPCPEAGRRAPTSKIPKTQLLSVTQTPPKPQGSGRKHSGKAGENEEEKAGHLGGSPGGPRVTDYKGVEGQRGRELVGGRGAAAHRAVSQTLALRTSAHSAGICGEAGVQTVELAGERATLP